MRRKRGSGDITIIEFADYTKCFVCGRAARKGGKEEVILSPPQGDGFKEPLAWAHPRCLRIRTLEVIEHLRLMIRPIRRVSPMVAKTLLRAVVTLRERFEDGENVWSGTVFITGHAFEELTGLKIAKTPRAELCWKLVMAVAYLEKMLYPSEKASVAAAG
jgi:hypothetical protein